MIVNPELIPNSDNTDYVMKVLLERYPNVEPDGRITIALARKYLSGTHYEKKVLKSLENI